jgi:8-oxo-dGTP pyrophosphatase MutT (NUDIX family)
VTGGFAVRGTTERFAGPMFSVVTDEVEMPGGVVAARDYMRHIGSVGVVPYDEAGQVVLVRQYRHPVRRPLWELPAGLVDVAGESLPEVAVRELAEESDLLAARLDLLVDLHTSPGCSDERIRIFLARDLSPAPHRHPREHEEATMTVARFPLDEAVGMVFRGEITNAAAVAGILTTAHARDRAWSVLRPVDATTRA